MNQRLTHLRSFFQEKKLDGILIASSVQIAYLTGYHGFSLVEREAYLLVTKTQPFLITDARYTEEVRKACPKITILERNAKTPTSRHIEKICKEQQIERLGFEPDSITITEYKQFKFNKFTLVPYSLHALRIQKNEEEIAAIQKACQIGDETFTYIQTQIAEDITEKELAKRMELFIREKDATLSFETIVAFGKNAAIPHHHTDDTRLTTGNTILLDFGVKYENYCSDMTRTIFFKSITDKQKKIYETVKKAQEKAIEYVNQELRILHQEKPKTNDQRLTTDMRPLLTSNIDKAARSYILDNNFPSIPHGLGHGIGLEVHEAPHLSPLSKEHLTEGMVFSIEPGIYFPHQGSTRIEDLFTIQHNKLQQLTKSSKEILII
ncbi:aminopeptidase P family protein [soil metagenome]